MNEDSFYSLDRLIEFGLGMGVATQMIHSMNESLRTMHMPGAGNQMQQETAPYFYVILDGSQAGPFATSEIVKLVQERKLTSDSYVWKPGMPDWKLAKEVPEILKIVALAPPKFDK